MNFGSTQTFCPLQALRDSADHNREKKPTRSLAVKQMEMRVMQD